MFSLFVAVFDSRDKIAQKFHPDDAIQVCPIARYELKQERLLPDRQVAHREPQRVFVVIQTPMTDEVVPMVCIADDEFGQTRSRYQIIAGFAPLFPLYIIVEKALAIPFISHLEPLI